MHRYRPSRDVVIHLIRGPRGLRKTDLGGPPDSNITILVDGYVSHLRPYRWAFVYWSERGLSRSSGPVLTAGTA